ncbi:MAG: ribosomal protein methylthiotransferase, partial [Campylobacterota bacterium]|nr:ribosomal protein methylthiotransferase [Campylobacterota bacterium]
GFDRINVFAYSDEETTIAHEMKDKIPSKTINKRAKILGDIALEVVAKSLQNELSKEVDIVIDGVSDEHEYILSARELLWAPDIDGEIFVTDKSGESELLFGTPYRAKITQKIGDTLSATVYNT